MDNGKMRKIVIVLILISAAIYGLQMLIFHDYRNTAFYILQDFAFMPVTIAIATFVVEELMSAAEKKERMEKTKMLTSTFYTEVGTSLTKLLVQSAEPRKELNDLLTMRCKNAVDLKTMQDKINQLDIRVELTEEIYTQIMDKVKGARTAILVLSSNPMLFEHEDFTDLLWALFHLIDEYNLRGEYEKLGKGDICHLNEDYSELLRLLMINYVANAMYMRDTYPNLYRTAREKLEDAIEKE